MIKPLLIEIGVEELPAVPFLKELPNIEKKWLKILEENSLKCAFEFFYTPRRLVLWHENFLLKQPDSFEEMFGAPKDIAFKDDKPTQAALSFAKKCGVDVEYLEFKDKNSKEVLYYKKEIKGLNSKEILGDMVKSFLDSLNFGKSMRWGEGEDSFIRPIRWLGCMLGDEYVGFQAYGVDTKYFSYGHRALGYEPFAYQTPTEYFAKLENSGVILFQKKRKTIILKQMEELELKHDIKIEKDEYLLNEVVAITEYPTSLVGRFDEHFLTLPPEVIVTSMKEHQRYFSCLDKNGRLTNRFIVISNALCEDKTLVVEGNEKVLRARLSDALFFWDNDLRNGLNSKGLKDVVFFDGLGSVFDKVKREERIGAYLGQKYMTRLKEELSHLKEEEILSLLDRTISLSKADLLSEMVYEFTELEGLMGYYYAKANKEDEFLALALKEQYLPNSLSAQLPSSIFSAIVAMCYKLDSLMALFSINKVPTGTKDPYALRRAVVGVLKIVLKYKLPFDIKNDFSTLLSIYDDFKIDKLEDFVIERMYSFFDVNPSVLKAVLQSNEREVLKIAQKVDALNCIVKSSEFKQSFTTFKRVANIIENVDIEQTLNIDESLFESIEEKALHEGFLKVKNSPFETYEERLDSLFGLKNLIDNFFDNVMVNVDSQPLKTNRQNLLGVIYQEFKSIADIKEITI